MNIKMITNNYQQLNLKKKSKQKKQTKQTTRSGTESQVWELKKGLSAGRGKGEKGGGGIGMKDHK